MSRGRRGRRDVCPLLSLPLLGWLSLCCTVSMHPTGGGGGGHRIDYSVQHCPGKKAWSATRHPAAGGSLCCISHFSQPVDMYRARLKGAPQVGWVVQASSGRSGKKEQQQPFSRALYVCEAGPSRQNKSFSNLCGPVFSLSFPSPQDKVILIEAA